jgi:hypothetical protein
MRRLLVTGFMTLLAGPVEAQHLRDQLSELFIFGLTRR